MSDYYDEPWSEPYGDDWFVHQPDPHCICEDGDWPHPHCPVHGDLESFETPGLSELPQEAPDTIPQHWGFTVTAADPEQLARETYEDILGFNGTGDETVDALEGKGGHKPPRSDIQKYKTAWEEQTAEQRIRRFDNQDDPRLQRLTQDWKQKTEWTPIEAAAWSLYQNHYLSGLRGGTENPAQWAFVETGRDLEHSSQAAQLAGLDPMTQRIENTRPIIGAALKKFEYRHYPKLYNGIKDTLDDFMRRGGDEESGWSHKLWPWAVSELKRQFAQNLWEKPMGQSSMWEDQTGRRHLVDIVDQTGKLLDKLRQEHRLPQGLDANQFKSVQEMEDWLYDYQREHGVGDTGGKTAHEFDDGWKVLKLHQPEQLEWEGDQMNHCVGGYWQQVRDGRSHIYSIRDPENKPHATLEFNPPYDEDGEYYRLLGEPVDKNDGEAIAALLREHNVKDKPEGKHLMPVWNSAEEYSDAIARANALNLQEGGNDRQWQTRHLLEAATKLGLFENAPSPHGGEPFVEASKEPVWMGLGRNGERGARPYEPDAKNESVKRAILNQHMGPHDKTPDAQANQHIRDWFDHHRNNGWQIERSHDFFYPNDWSDYGGGSYPDDWRDHDYGYLEGIRNRDRREGTGAASMLDDWWKDHFRQNPSRWTGIAAGPEDLDIYGLPYGNDNEDEGVKVHWDDLNPDVMRALSDTYDHYAWHTHNWEDLAKAYWHAFHLEHPQVTNQDLSERAKNEMRSQITAWEEQLHEYEQNDSDYYDHDPRDIREKYEEMGGPIPKDEDGDDETDYDDDHPDVDEDTWQEARWALDQKNAEYTYGNNYKFINYLYHLNEHPDAPRTPRALHDAQVNGTFPSYNEVAPPPPEPTGTEDMPGTFSKVAEAIPQWMVQQPEGQWYKWGFHPDRGALMWPVNGQDGNQADMQAGKAHIDFMNKAWGRPGRYPFHPQDSTGVVFHKPETNQVFVSQYPRRNGERVNPMLLPALEQKIRSFHPDSEIVWPDNPSWDVRTSGFDFGPPSFDQPGYSQAFRYDPVSDQTYWGSGHGVIDSKLYRMGIGPDRIKGTLEGRWRPGVNEIEYYSRPDHLPEIDREALRQRLLQEAAERAYERPWGDGSPFLAAHAEPVDTEHGKFLEAMRLAYDNAHLSGEVIDFQQYRNQRNCPVCNSAVKNKDGLIFCPHCSWMEGDPVETCSNCGGKNTIQMTNRFRQWPYECVNCHEVFNDEERNRLH